MTPPINMNVVLAQTPTVEKMQQADKQNPENIQRQSSIREAEEHRQRTETVPDTKDTKETRPNENEKDEKENEKKTKKQAASDAEDGQDQELDTSAESSAGHIIDVVI